MAFSFICNVDDIWENEMKEFSVDGHKLLLVHCEGGGFSAFGAMCPHQEFPLIQGDLNGRVLTCTAHLWEFDASTGRGINPVDCSLTRFAVRIENSRVHVDVSARLED